MRTNLALLGQFTRFTPPCKVLESTLMIDMKLPATEGRLLVTPRYTRPEPDQQMLLAHLHFTT